MTTFLTSIVGCCVQVLSSLVDSNDPEAALYYKCQRSSFKYNEDGPPSGASLKRAVGVGMSRRKSGKRIFTL